jgi:hypothetical protein
MRTKEQYKDPKQLELFSPNFFGKLHPHEELGGFFIPEDVRQELLDFNPRGRRVGYTVEYRWDR